MIELQTMNEIPIYTIIKIEAEEAEIPMLTFYVKEDSMDEPEDPRHWQMEWMDNYMDALEELEDSTTRE